MITGIEGAKSKKQKAESRKQKAIVAIDRSD